MKYPVYRPSLTGNEKKYVNDCIDTTWISSKGGYIDRFEKSFAAYIGSPYCTSVFNGTVAIHLIIEALGIGPGDEVIVPTFTYIASANPILQNGATPVFVDSLRDTWQMDPKDVQAKITSRTKAIMVVHLYGHPCDMDSIMSIAKQYNLFVIEDCAEASGTLYKGRHVGTFGDAASFSFFGNKTITCGEGGMVATPHQSLYKRMAHLKAQGVASFKEYWHDVMAFNYRMTNIQAAIGLAQLEQIDSFVNAKRQIALWYQEELQGLPLEFHKPVGDVVHSYWMISLLTESEAIRTELRKHLSEAGIETRPTFYPIHTMPVYNKKLRCFPIAEDIAYRGINLPSYPALLQNDIKNIAGVVRDFYGK